MSTVRLPLRRRSEPCCAITEKPRMTKRQTSTVADVLRAAGDETRLRMLDLIAQQPEPICVCDLTDQFEQNQPTISHHLRLLRDAGLVDTEKRGIWGYYWATDAGRKVLAACEALS